MSFAARARQCAEFLYPLVEQHLHPQPRERFEGLSFVECININRPFSFQQLEAHSRAIWLFLRLSDAPSNLLPSLELWVYMSTVLAYAYCDDLSRPAPPNLEYYSGALTRPRTRPLPPAFLNLIPLALPVADAYNTQIAALRANRGADHTALRDALKSGAVPVDPDFFHNFMYFIERYNNLSTYAGIYNAPRLQLQYADAPSEPEASVDTPGATQTSAP